MFAGFLEGGRIFYNILLTRGRRVEGEGPQPPRYQEASR
jgi:hypothetical protein